MTETTRITTSTTEDKTATAPTTVTTDTSHTTETNNILAPFNPTNALTQTVALETLFTFSTADDTPDHNAQKPCVLFDLGCGDGRLLLEAVQRYENVVGVGLELDDKFVQRAREAAQTQLSPSQQARFQVHQADLTDPVWWQGRSSDADNQSDTPTTLDYNLWDDATHIYLYLLPKGLRKIQPYLNALVQARRQPDGSPSSPKLQIICCTFSIPEWTPVRVENTGKSGIIKTYLYEY